MRLRLWSILAPCMKNGEETNAGAQMCRVSGNGEQSFGCSVGQDVVDVSLL